MYQISLILLLSAYCCLAQEGQVAQNDSKIVGGFLVNIKDYPYQLYLSSNKGRCGASIISSDWALTAAHCLYGATVLTSNAVFRAGSTNRNQGGTQHRAIEIKIHPWYNPFITDYDFAVVKVSPPFPIGTPGVNKIDLGSVPPADNTLVTASGWGLTSGFAISQPNNLQAANMYTQSRAQCQRLMFTFTSRMICAKANKVNICNGDSGGPLVDRKTMIQYGIMSMTFRRCPPGYAGFFSNVADQRAWIRSVTGV